ncbi:MAG TPA: protein kinase, partial [Candidatus Krumholzibacterium sp.]|nr:protein kinase [Candidatus Krumholzibacterium sp.]
MVDRNYQILSTLATGGTAVLYKAIQTSLGREVVIKRLHSHLTSDRNFTSRFELEAKAAASLDHENIVRIIDSGISKDNYFIVMEYIDGLTLKELLERSGPLDVETTLMLAREICLGLDHA